tara:strand:+ start:642 stop:863 length:222 start_codon:yes stop_codon:yes gene_type:complete
VKVEKISPINIPAEHYKWAGIDPKQKASKKNSLSAKKLNRIIKKVYSKKWGIYNCKGEFVPFAENKRGVGEDY